MTNDELIDARKTLGLTLVEFAKTFGVANFRTVHGWEMGVRNGKPNSVPEPIAKLVTLALKYPSVRRELGIARRQSEAA